MGKIKEDELLRILVEQQFISREQAIDCSTVAKQTRELGLKQTVLDVAVQKGYLTKDRRVEAVRFIKSRGQDRPSVSIPGYEIQDKIGQGGMGTVYRGVQVTLDRPVAIKVLPKRLSSDQVFVQRFLREARSAAKIDHPHVVRAIDAGESNGTYYFIMEFVPGQSLKEVLKERGPLSEEEALDIMEQIADALMHAETLGIIHRDIKPDNIMITPNGVAKLSDLGLAREVCDLSVTMAGTVIGTPYYMSPEQIQGKPDIDVRSDIYSLGATLFQALTNQYPFNATTPAAVIAKHLNDPRPDPAVKNPAVSKPMTRLVRKMMARERNNRPQSGAELMELIDRTREAPAEDTAGRRRPAAGRRRQQPAEEGRRPPQKSGPSLPMLLGIGGGVLAIIVIAVLLLSGDGKPDAVPGHAVPDTPAVAAPERPRTKPDTPPVVVANTTPERPADTPPDREQEASEALRVAEDERALDADNLPAALRLMSGVARKYPKTAAGKKAAAEENAIRSAIDDRLAKVKSSAVAWVGKTRFKEAEQAYLHFLKTIPEDPWKTRAEKEIEGIEKKAQAELRRRRKEIDALVAGRDFAKAHDMLMAVMDGTTVRLRKTMTKDVQALEQKRREVAEKQANREALLAEARQEALKHLEKGKLGDLIETYGNLQMKSRFADARSLLTKELDAFKKLRTLADNAEKGAISRIGQEFKVQGIVGTVAGAGGGTIRIASGGAEFVQPILKLKTSEILSLAGLGADRSRNPVGVAMLYLWQGETDKASRALEEQRQKGIDVDVQISLVEEVEKRHAESKAGKLIAAIKKLVAVRKWTKASDAITTLRTEYSGTTTFAEANKYLEKIEARIEGEVLKTEPVASVGSTGGKTTVDALHPVPGMVGKIRRVSSVNGFRAEYKFDAANELEDWEGKDSNSKQWSVEKGVLVGKRGLLTHKMAFVGDILIEAKVLSTSRFSLQIGEYRFEWCPYSSGGTNVSARKRGVLLPGGSNYLYRVPVGTLQMRWVKKKNELIWYCWGNKSIIKAKDWGTVNQDSTVRIEPSVYTTASYRGTIYGGTAGGTDGFGEVRIEEIKILGAVDATWFRGVLQDAREK